MLSLLDLILIGAVSVQCLFLAYLRHPVAKSRVLLVPVPVTFGILSVGLPIDITHVGGLLLSMGFTLSVLLLYTRLRVPILPTIILAAAGYGTAAAYLGSRLPRTEAVFWCGVAAVVAVAAVALRVMPPRAEAAYGSPLPVWVKALTIILVVATLVLVKKQLQGFLTTFPMLGVVASYETRRSLYTTSRQIPISCLAFAAAFGLCHVLQNRWGLYLALIPTLATYAAGVVFLNRATGLTMPAPQLR